MLHPRERYLVAICFTPLLLLVVLRLLWADRVAMLPRHWSSFGSTPTSVWDADVVFALTMFGASLGGCLVLIAHRSKWSSSVRRELSAVGAGIAGVASMVWIVPASVVASGTDAYDVTLGWPFAVIPLGAALAVLPPLMLPRQHHHDPIETQPGPKKQFEHTFSGTGFSVLTAIFGALGVVVLIAARSTGLPAEIGVLLVLGAVVCALFVRTRLLVDKEAIRTQSWCGGLKLCSVDVSDIAKIGVGHASSGAYNYAVLPGLLTLTMGQGETLVIRRRDGKRVEISVSDSESALSAMGIPVSSALRVESV